MESLCIAADLRMYNLKHGATEESPTPPFSTAGSLHAIQQGMEPGYQVAD